MSIKFLLGAALSLVLGVSTTCFVNAIDQSSEFSNENSVEDISHHEGRPVEEHQKDAGFTEETYDHDAKVLANKIKQGFIETSKLPSLTSCISKGTASYAGFTSAQDKEKADSITEKYLLMGKDEKLDLSNQEAVYNFLIKKFDERIAQNVQTGSQYLGGIFIQKAGTCVSMAGNALYKYRLNQALDWAFKSEVKG